MKVHLPLSGHAVDQYVRVIQTAIADGADVLTALQQHDADTAADRLSQGLNLIGQVRPLTQAGVDAVEAAKSALLEG